MKLGFALPHLGDIAGKDSIRRAATEAENLGYHSLWTDERVLVPVNAKTPYPGAADGILNKEYENVYEHLTVLSYAAAFTPASGSASA